MNNKTAGIVTIVALIAVVAYALYGKVPETNTPSEKPEEAKKVQMGRVVGVVQSPGAGKYLTDDVGMALYVFSDDKELESTCNDACLENWIPYKWDTTQNFEIMTFPLDKKINSAKRSDGTRQYAYGDQPLYYYAGDKAMGDTKGNNLDNGKWKLIPITE